MSPRKVVDPTPPTERQARLKDLDPAPWNPRRHDARNVEAIATSLERFGQLKPVVCRPVGARLQIVAGHGTVLAAEGLGWSAVRVWVSEMSDPEARAFAVADNRTTDLSDWDPAALLAIVRDDPMGFDEDEIQRLFDDVERDLAASIEEEKPDTPAPAPAPELEEPEVPSDPTTRLGDVIRLGEHVLVCGDSLAAEAWDAVSGGRRADLVVTDPPYAIYGSSTGIASDVADGRMIEPFFRSVGVAIAKRLKLHGHAYTFCDWRSYPTIAGAYRRPLDLKNVLVWDKAAGLGSMYANAYELIAFHAVGRRQQMSNVQRGEHDRQRMVRAQNILRFPRTSGDERPHNASKPVALVSELIENSSDPGELVADFFGGGGTTLVAAEQTERRAILFEVDPGWCDVIVARWERLTGRKAKRPRRRAAQA